MNHNSSQPIVEEHNGPLDEIDFDKIVQVGKGSIVWIILAFLATLSGSFLYLRYTKPIYSSQSVLKLDIKDESGLLGIQNPMRQDIKGLSGEIEILRSGLFMTKVAEAIDYDVSYYHPGRSHLVDERFGNSPFEIIYNSFPDLWKDRRIDVVINDDRTFKLPDITGNDTHTFGVMIEQNGFEFSIEKTSYFENQKSLVNFYFVVNSIPAIAEYLLQNVTVEPINFNANTIKVSFTDPNKFKAQAFVNAIDTLYLRYTHNVKNQASEQQIKFLNQQMTKTVKELEEYEDYFESFTIEHRTTNLSEDLSNAILALNQIDSQRFYIRNNLAAIESIESQLNLNAQISTTNLPKNVIATVEEYNALIEEKELKLDNYNENTQVVLRIKHRLEIAQKAAKQRLEDYRENLLKSKKELNRKRALLENTFSQLPSMGTSYNKKQRMYTMQEEYYFNLIKSKMELEIAKAGTVTNFVILSSATLPVAPIEPKKFIVYGIGGVAGLILSIIIIAASYLLHDKISNQKELEKRLNIPILGVVPKYQLEKLELTKLVVNNNPKSPISESLRAIRTNMEFINSDGPTRVMSVTSTVSGEGKTFLGVNLGAICAYSGQKVVVVDLDMRKPKVNIAFDVVKRNHGTSTILIGKNSIDECIEQSSVENLHFIQAGTTPPNPSELLLSDHFKQMAEELKEKFDLVIFDTPPVGLVTDAIMVMKTSDLPIYVVRADYSKLNYLKSIQRLVSNNKFEHMSVVLNGIRNGSGGYGYGYGYGTGYYEEENKKKFKIPFLNKS
ncbi:GumC family protein [Reichenbachiella versicolor]|uniref:GumC family protein n=1 Tax=Reichenbachiella versicolor TaxID=1821036 RepID=UPI000D6E3187|nr:polysaccharide biosynthesis tyrosine autokinase [Reichenbachiella versicolor]